MSLLIQPFCRFFLLWVSPCSASPNLHRAAQLDLAELVNRLALKEEQDEASIAAIRHAKQLSGTVSAASMSMVRLWPSRFHTQIGLWLVRQARSAQDRCK